MNYVTRKHMSRLHNRYCQNVSTNLWPRAVEHNGFWNCNRNINERFYHTNNLVKLNN